MKLKRMGKVISGKRFLLKIKENVYRSCIRSVMLCESETWCSKENEMAILSKIARAIVRVTCIEKLVERVKEKLMNLLHVRETVDKLEKANKI